MSRKRNDTRLFILCYFFIFGKGGKKTYVAFPPRKVNIDTRCGLFAFIYVQAADGDDKVILIIFADLK